MSTVCQPAWDNLTTAYIAAFDTYDDYATYISNKIANLTTPDTAVLATNLANSPYSIKTYIPDLNPSNVVNGGLGLLPHMGNLKVPQVVV